MVNTVNNYRYTFVHTYTHEHSQHIKHGALKVTLKQLGTPGYTSDTIINSGTVHNNIMCLIVRKKKNVYVL